MGTGAIKVSSAAVFSTWWKMEECDGAIELCGQQAALLAAPCAQTVPLMHSCLLYVSTGAAAAVCFPQTVNLAGQQMRRALLLV